MAFKYLISVSTSDDCRWSVAPRWLFLDLLRRNEFKPGCFWHAHKRKTHHRPCPFTVAFHWRSSLEPRPLKSMPGWSRSVYQSECRPHPLLYPRFQPTSNSTSVQTSIRSRFLFLSPVLFSCRTLPCAIRWMSASAWQTCPCRASALCMIIENVSMILENVVYLAELCLMLPPFNVGLGSD